MVRFISILLIILLFVFLIGMQTTWFDGPKPSLDLKYDYLVVTIEGPPKWDEDHQFSVQWQGQTIPGLFRLQ